MDTSEIADERNRNHDDDSINLEDELISDIPDIPGIPPRELPEDLEKIQEITSIENDKLVTSSRSDTSDDKSKTDSGSDDDFKDIDDSLFTDIESYISSITSIKKTLPNNPKTDKEIKVEKNDDDFNSEIINHLPEEVRSSKSPEVTNPQLTHDVLKAQLQSIVHSNLGTIQNKSPKNHFEYAQFHPYRKKKVKTPPQKSLEYSKENNTQLTASNTATESNAEFKQLAQDEEELMISGDNKINSAQMSQPGTTNDS